MSLPSTSPLHSISHPDHNSQARSLLDLIELGTVDLETAAWLVSQVARGASYITGSGPGGIGKTTTMHSLLSFVPKNLSFKIALPGAVEAIDNSPHCIISNELSDHPPPSYLWDQDLRNFFAHSTQGHLLVGNVHADDLNKIHDQIVGENAVPEIQFRAVKLLIFICLEGGNPPGQRRIKDNTTRRIINKIFYSDGHNKHQPIYNPTSGLTTATPRHLEHEKHCRAFLQEALNSTERSILAVREQFIQWNS